MKLSTHNCSSLVCSSNTLILARSYTTYWEKTVNKMETLLPACKKFSVWWGVKWMKTIIIYYEDCILTEVSYKQKLNEELVKVQREVAKPCKCLCSRNKSPDWVCFRQSEEANDLEMHEFRCSLGDNGWSVKCSKHRSAMIIYTLERQFWLGCRKLITRKEDWRQRDHLGFCWSHQEERCHSICNYWEIKLYISIW